jgi:hypothetical protein
MGDLQSYSLISWNEQYKLYTNEISGTIVVLVYETTYEKGIGTETLTIHKSLTGDTFAILGHHFNSELIQEYINKGIEQVASKSETRCQPLSQKVLCNLSRGTPVKLKDNFCKDRTQLVSAIISLPVGARNL